MSEMVREIWEVSTRPRASLMASSCAFTPTALMVKYATVDVEPVHGPCLLAATPAGSTGRCTDGTEEPVAAEGMIGQVGGLATGGGADLTLMQAGIADMSFSALEQELGAAIAAMLDNWIFPIERKRVNDGTGD
jgi:hypothetical protein